MNIIASAILSMQCLYDMFDCLSFFDIYRMRD